MLLPCIIYSFGAVLYFFCKLKNCKFGDMYDVIICSVIYAYYFFNGISNKVMRRYPLFKQSQFIQQVKPVLFIGPFSYTLSLLRNQYDIGVKHSTVLMFIACYFSRLICNCFNGCFFFPTTQLWCEVIVFYVLSIFLGHSIQMLIGSNLVTLLGHSIHLC